MDAELWERTCSDDHEHICNAAGSWLHHSALDHPFSDGTTEHAVGECERCAEWDALRSTTEAE